MNDLKLCPFCGSKAQLLIVPGRVAHWVVRCSKGCCNTCQHISDHDAEEAWNKRIAEAHPDEQEAQRDYEASVEMAEYCERYEPTYNPEDGSM